MNPLAQQATQNARQNARQNAVPENKGARILASIARALETIAKNGAAPTTAESA
jgi:hypothetical protein